MWMPKAILDYFKISKESVDALREDLSGVRAERDNLVRTLATTQANFNWLMGRVNQLEIERAQLLEAAYGLKIPVPEIVRPTSHAGSAPFNSDLFEDMGESMAKNLGLPTYN